MLSINTGLASGLVRDGDGGEEISKNVRTKSTERKRYKHNLNIA